MDIQIKTFRIVLLTALFLISVQQHALAIRTFYVDAVIGNDANSGLSPAYPFRTLAKASSLTYQGGDAILLASGQTFQGSLHITDSTGSAVSRIVVGTTGSAKAVIDAAGYSAGVNIIDSSYVTVTNLEITADGGGVFTDRPSSSNVRSGVFIGRDSEALIKDIVLEDLHIHDIYHLDPGGIRDDDQWGFGIYGFLRNCDVEDVTVRRCRIERTSNQGVMIKSDLSVNNEIHNVLIEDCRLSDLGESGIKLKLVKDSAIRGCQVRNSGSSLDPRMAGWNTGIWVSSVENVVIEKNMVSGARGDGDSRGIHIDTDNWNVIVQYNLLVDNIGGFCHIVGGSSNCVYRYNISVNEGLRREEAGGTGGDEGDVLSLRGDATRGYVVNSYVYNNTVYTRSGANARINLSTFTDGALYANNIIYAEDELLEGVRSNIEAAAQSNYRVYFDGNLFRAPAAWMSDPYTASNSTFANPQFADAGGINIADYVPANLACTNGIALWNLPGDAVGVVGGFDVAHDILGNVVDPSRPFLGAIRPYALPPTNGTMFHARFEEGADGAGGGGMLPYRFRHVVDSEGNNHGHSITETNGAVYVADVGLEKVPQTSQTNQLSLLFQKDALHGVEVPYAETFSFADHPYTLEAWVKRASVSSGQAYIMGKKTQSSKDADRLEYGFYLAGGTGALSLRRSDAASSFTTVTSPLAIADTNDWHHVSVAVDGTQIRFTLDGVVDEQVAGSVVSRVPYNAQGLLIGNHINNSNIYDGGFDGWIDEVRISAGVVPLTQLLNHVPYALISRFEVSLVGNSNEVRVDFSGTGMFDVYQSTNLAEGFFPVPIQQSVEPGEDVVIDSGPSGPQVFYKLLPSG